MAKFDHNFLEEMQSMFNVDLIGVASVTKSGSKDLKKYANALLPGAKSVIKACPSKALQMPKKGQAYAMNPYACGTYRVAGLNCSVCMKACDESLSKKRA